VKNTSENVERAAYSIRFGEYDVFPLRDGLLEVSLEVSQHLDGESARQAAMKAVRTPSIRMDVNCFLLRNSKQTILIDSGLGSAWGPGFGNVLKLLKMMKISPDEIQRIFLTHFHDDHALGLFNGDTAYFSEADIMVPMMDYEFFLNPRNRDRTPVSLQGGFDIAPKLQNQYRDRIKFLRDNSDLDGFQPYALPGHTPGHTGYLIRGKRESLMIIGDVLHLPDIQAADPKVGLKFDLDPIVAAHTRQSLFESSANEGWVIAGGHTHGFARVEEMEDGFRLVVVK